MDRVTIRTGVDINKEMELLAKLKALLDGGAIIQSEYDMIKSVILGNVVNEEERNWVSGHEYVDLGLPSGTKWATYNVGATKPTEYGDYFAQGETKPKEDYSDSTYKWCKGSDDSMTKYCTNSKYGTVDNKMVLDAEDDAATANWGSAWRMPTAEEIDELFMGCKWEWVEFSVHGLLGTSRKNGSTIFLPAAGNRSATHLSLAGNSGYYWSSSLSEGSSNYANYLDFYDDYIYRNGSDRGRGQSVRAVLR